MTDTHYVTHIYMLYTCTHFFIFVLLGLPLYTLFYLAFEYPGNEILLYLLCIYGTITVAWTTNACLINLYSLLFNLQWQQMNWVKSYKLEIFCALSVLQILMISMKNVNSNTTHFPFQIYPRVMIYMHALSVKFSYRHIRQASESVEKVPSTAKLTSNYIWNPHFHLIIFYLDWYSKWNNSLSNGWHNSQIYNL